ncbi:MAG: hypothetical protein H7196_04090 [candidate division SR1 bacterium]|nr:hypothetical protein [candidate division SR1 bacterium]
MKLKLIAEKLGVTRQTIKKLEDDFEGEIIEFYELFLQLRMKKKKLNQKIKAGVGSVK